MGAQAVRLSNGDIDNALKDKDFEVLFQPIFDLGNGALARVETFIRWRHPTLGVLPPGAFISFFETQGRMSELTRYVLGEALAAYKSWRGAHAPGFSINLALSDLSDESFPSHFTVLLREHGFPAELVTLECPMPPVEADTDTVAKQLARLSATGARLAIEVRGRANDFLKTVRPFPFAEIKTGGAAILRFARTVRGPGLSAISELLELAAEQNAAITAVGVEDQASLSALRGLGFAAAQGNHLGRVGTLSQFMPSHVNDVRKLLGLDPLSSEDLSALFRTGAPHLAAAPVDLAEDDVAPEIEAAESDAEEPLFEEPADEASPAQEVETDDLVQRLAARIARAEGKDADEISPEEQKRLKAKAAAIARAKRNGKLRERLAARNALKEKADARNETGAPRDLQDRLSREFGELADEQQQADEIEFTDAPAEDVSRFDKTVEETMEAAPADEIEPEADEAPAPAASLEDIAPELSREPEAEPEAEPIKQAPIQTFNARLAVGRARARFSPPIRVSGPETVLPERDAETGDLYREPPATAQSAPATETAETPTASVISEIEIEDEIPEPLSNAAWLEETVEIFEAADAEPKKRRRRNFLHRTVVPYSALKVTHFWPRAIRRRMKRAEAAE